MAVRRPPTRPSSGDWDSYELTVCPLDPAAPCSSRGCAPSGALTICALPGLVPGTRYSVEVSLRASLTCDGMHHCWAGRSGGNTHLNAAHSPSHEVRRRWQSRPRAAPLGPSAAPFEASPLTLLLALSQWPAARVRNQWHASHQLQRGGHHQMHHSCHVSPTIVCRPCLVPVACGVLCRRACPTGRNHSKGWCMLLRLEP